MNQDSLNLINGWIINKLCLLQDKYNGLLGGSNESKWQISNSVNKVIEFSKNSFSKEYLELIKIFDVWDEATKKTVSLVYRQLLSMLYPAIPSVTSFLYNRFFKKKIPEVGLLDISHLKNEDIQKDLWQVDCCVLVVKIVRSVKKKEKKSCIFFLELFSDWKEKKQTLDINFFLEKIEKTKISVFKEKNKDELSKFVQKSIFPFGVVWYSFDTKDRVVELQKELEFCIFEIKRAKSLLFNLGFLNKAPIFLVEKEKKQLVYYKEQKKKLEQQIKDLDNK